MNAHDTLIKFGYPSTLIATYRSWVVMLRPQQPTIGSLVIAFRDDIRRFSDVPREAFSELSQIVSDCEAALLQLFSYDRINYLMLMMVDPQVHMHVLPRYAEKRAFAGAEHADAGWPGPPRLDADLGLSDEAFEELLATLRGSWRPVGES